MPWCLCTQHPRAPIMCFSPPASRYICSGSEDQAAYGWDLRQGSLAFKLRGAHGDAVTDVAFNPCECLRQTFDARKHTRYTKDVCS
jgi:WD40 repeat protein